MHCKHHKPFSLVASTAQIWVTSYTDRHFDFLWMACRRRLFCSRSDDWPLRIMLSLERYRYLCSVCVCECVCVWFRFLHCSSWRNKTYASLDIVILYRSRCAGTQAVHDHTPEYHHKLAETFAIP